MKEGIALSSDELLQYSTDEDQRALAAV